MSCWEPIVKCCRHSCSELTFKLPDHFCAPPPPPHQVMKGVDFYTIYRRKKKAHSDLQREKKLHLPYFNPPVIMSRAERVRAKLNCGSINKPLCPLCALIRCSLDIFHVEICETPRVIPEHKMLLRQYSLQSLAARVQLSR